MLDLAKLVIRICGNKVNVVRRSSPDVQYTTDNPQRRCPDIGKSRQQLGYNPKVGLEAGLQRTRDYYLDHSEN